MLTLLLQKKASYQCKEKLSSYHFCFQVKAGKKRKKRCGNAKKQLKKDLKSAEVSCNEDYPNDCENITSVICKYTGFVVMPKCPPGDPSVPKDAQVILQDDCEDKNAFFNWWKTNVAGVKSNPHFDQKFFEYLVMR